MNTFLGILFLLLFVSAPFLVRLPLLGQPLAASKFEIVGFEFSGTKTKAKVRWADGREMRFVGGPGVWTAETGANWYGHESCVAAELERRWYQHEAGFR